jgi:hypothetical protein
MLSINLSLHFLNGNDAEHGNQFAMMLNMVISLSQFQFIVDMHKW